MKCPKCKVNIPDNSSQCPVCGSTIQGGRSAGNQVGGYVGQGAGSHSGGSGYTAQGAGGHSGGSGYAGQEFTGAYSGDTVEPSERVMASLGNSYATTALSGGGFGKTSLFFTNKRVYAKYKEYTTKGKSNVDAIIDLKEISGTLLSQSNPIALMVIGVLIALLGFGTAAMAVNPVPAIVGIIIGGIFVIRWWLHRTVLMEISFQGDRISIMLKGYSYETANQFHKSLRGYLATIKNI